MFTRDEDALVTCILLNQRSYINKGRALYKYVMLCFAYVIFERISLTLFDKEAEIRREIFEFEFSFSTENFFSKTKDWIEVNFATMDEQSRYNLRLQNIIRFRGK